MARPSQHRRPLLFDEWIELFRSSLPEFQDAAKDLTQVVVRGILAGNPFEIQEINFLVFLYTGGFHPAKAHLLEWEPAPNARTFARRLYSVAKSIELFQRGGLGDTFSLHTIRVMQEKTPWAPVSFLELPVVLTAYGRMVELFCGELNTALADPRLCKSRILTLLARCFKDSRGRVRYLHLARLLVLGYWAHGVEKDERDVALAIRNRLDRYKEKDPGEFERWFRRERLRVANDLSNTLRDIERRA
jgi:hypothetical protein